MSAFLVSVITINRIVATIRSRLKPHKNAAIAEMFSAIGIDPTQANWEETLATAMYVLNQQALHCRYGDPINKRLIYIRWEPLPSLYQTLKSIECWLYQCAEGDVPESKLYQFFSTFVRNWSLEAIVYDSPEYEKAQWG